MDASDGEQWVQRLCRVTNGHDLEALVDCFAEDYVNEAPAHPARGFRGRDQVRKNWTQIFAALPDLTCTVRSVVAGDAVWSEWDMKGTRRDGVTQRTRGVIIFGVADGRAVSARFYLEPVDESATGVDAAIRDLVDARDAAPASPPASSQ